MAQAGILVLALATARMLYAAEWTAAGVLAVFLAGSILVVAVRSDLPRFFEALFVLAALGNAAGYVWNLFDGTAWFDEVAHFYTGFAVTLAFGFLLYRELMRAFRSHRFMFVLTITAMGIAIGALWEIVEWSIEIFFNTEMIGTVQDTITDLMLDSAGAFLASLANLKGLNEQA